MKKPNAVIFDVDGTLCCHSKKRDELAKEHRWEEYHQLAEYEPPVPAVVLCAQKFKKLGSVIVIMTARPEKWRAKTEEWMEKNHIPWNLLFMRENKDYRNSKYIKLEQLKLLRETLNVELAFEDHKENIWAFEDAGLPVVRIRSFLNRPWRKNGTR